jgi:acyl-CoA thioesterase FadM
LDGHFRTVVSFDDTDCSRRVHFSRYSIWIDRAIQDLFRKMGLEFLSDGSLRRVEGGEVVAFAIGEYWTRIDRSSKLGDSLEVTVHPHEVRTRVVVFEGSVVDVSDKATVARGRITMIHIDISTGRSKEMPNWLVELLSAEKRY